MWVRFSGTVSGKVFQSVAGTLNKLAALMVSKAKDPGRYGDGAGFWLQIAAGGSKSWLIRYRRRGKARALGPGACHTVFAL